MATQLHDGQTWKERALAAAEFFTNATEQSGLNDVIDEAIVRGRRRRKKALVNVIVHPEFAWDKRTILQRDLFPEDRKHADRATELYGERIMAILEQDPKAIVISYTNAREHKKDFPYDDGAAIQTPPTHDGKTQGMLDAEGWRCFLAKLDGLKENDDIRIHGAAWNRCPKAFARQLLGTAVYGYFIPPHVRKEDEPLSTHCETLLTILHQRDDIRTKTRIRLGVQHNSQNVLCPDSLSKDLTEAGITKLHPRKKFRMKSIVTGRG